MKGYLFLMMILSSITFGEAAYLFIKLDIDLFARIGLIINLCFFWVLGLIKANSLMKV